MSEVKYSKEHEWIKLDGDTAVIGITQHATEMLGDIVFVELPEIGSSVVKDGNAGVVNLQKLQVIFTHLYLEKLSKTTKQLLMTLQRLIMIQKMKHGFLN